jgi:ADP-ribose pyrophosphatase YjhB (NUDIX family)
MDKIEDKIMQQFLFKNRLRFNEIEKGVNIRSNKLNYHLQNLVQKEIIIKEGEHYHLSKSSEHLIPYLSNKKHVLSVLLIHIGDSKKAFLIERKKRPYLGKLGMPGGRMILGESIEEGIKRIMKEKFGVVASLDGVCSVSLEHLKRDEEIVSSFMLFYVCASADVDLLDVEKNKGKIIESDYELITKDFEKTLEVGKFVVGDS